MPLKLWQLNAPHGLLARMCNVHKPKVSENAGINWIIRAGNVFFLETLKFYFHASFARKHGSTSLETEECDVGEVCPQFPDEKLCGQHLCS